MPSYDNVHLYWLDEESQEPRFFRKLNKTGLRALIKTIERMSGVLVVPLADYTSGIESPATPLEEMESVLCDNAELVVIAAPSVSLATQEIQGL